MTVHDIVGGTVWIQLMVLMAAMMFALFELFFAALGQRRHFTTRRRLGFAACLSVLVLPLMLPFLMTVPYAAQMNVTDAIVAQYLKGNISITAMEMSAFVDTRANWVSALSSGTSVLAQTIVACVVIAALLRIGYLAMNVARIMRAVRGGWVLRRTRWTRIVVSPSVTVPFSTRGLWRYYVVVPQSMVMDPGTLRMSLGHELQHIRQGDVDAEVLLSLVSPLFVLNPGYWYVSGRLRKLGELSCDRAYLAKGRFDAHSYTTRLLNIAQRGMANHGANHGANPNAFGVPLLGRALPWRGRQSMLKSRILEIAQDLDAPARDRRWIGAVLSLGLAACILAGAMSLARPADWSHERIMLSTVVNLERIENLNTLAQRSW